MFEGEDSGNYDHSGMQQEYQRADSDVTYIK